MSLPFIPGQIVSRAALDAPSGPAARQAVVSSPMGGMVMVNTSTTARDAVASDTMVNAR